SVLPRRLTLASQGRALSQAGATINSQHGNDRNTNRDHRDMRPPVAAPGRPSKSRCSIWQGCSCELPAGCPGPPPGTAAASRIASILDDRVFDDLLGIVVHRDARQHVPAAAAVVANGRVLDAQSTVVIVAHEEDGAAVSIDLVVFDKRPAQRECQGLSIVVDRAAAATSHAALFGGVAAFAQRPI